MKLITENKDYILLVDTERRDVGDIIYNSYNGKIAQIYFQQQQDEGFYKIIAYLPLQETYKLEGVPLLPKQEEEVYKLADEFRSKGSIIKHPDPYTNVFESGIYQGFIAGYKAASKKWSDEDMIDLLQFVFKSEDDYFMAGNWISGRIPSKDIFEKYKQSLSSTLTPIGFEPEYESELSAYYRNGLGGKELKIVNGVLQGKYKF
jgi:hypothetical protein